MFALPSSTPQFWWLLTEPDRAAYTLMRTYLMNDSESNQRNKRISSFMRGLEMIKNFCIRGDPNDAVRCIVCGIIWLNEGIASNTQQLSFLMGKCKSSINGSFQILGYKETTPRKNASDMISAAVPLLNGHRGELRKWTVRVLETATEEPKKDEFAAEDMMLKSSLEAAQTIDEDTVDFWSLAMPSDDLCF